MLDTKREHGITRRAFYDIVALAYGKDNADEKLSNIISKLHFNNDEMLLSAEKMRYTLLHFQTAVRLFPHLIQHALQLQVNEILYNNLLSLLFRTVSVKRIVGVAFGGTAQRSIMSPSCK